MPRRPVCAEEHQEVWEARTRDALIGPGPTESRPVRTQAHAVASDDLERDEVVIGLEAGGEDDDVGRVRASVRLNSTSQHPADGARHKVKIRVV